MKAWLHQIFQIMQKDEIILILTPLLKHGLREALVQELLVCNNHLQVTLSLSPLSLSIKRNREINGYFTVRLTVRVDPPDRKISVFLTISLHGK